MDRIVEAHEYVGAGRKRGGVAVSIEHSCLDVSSHASDDATRRLS